MRSGHVTSIGASSLKLLLNQGTKQTSLSVYIQDFTEDVWPLSDHLGSNTVLVNTSGTVVSERTYDPYGNVYSGSASNNPPDRFSFGNKERDADTGLMYFEARYLDTDVGRFTSVDPVFWSMNERWMAEPQRHNAYSYAGNNPVNYVDPDGRFFCMLMGGCEEEVALINYAADRVGDALDYVGEKTGHETLADAADMMFVDPFRAYADMLDEGLTAGQRVGAAVMVGLEVTPGEFDELAVKGVRRMWVLSKVGNRTANLTSHFGKHGAKLGFSSVDEYAQGASDFISQGKYTHKFETDVGMTEYYNHSTKDLVVTNPKGEISMYHRIDSEGKLNRFAEKAKNQ